MAIDKRIFAKIERIESITRPTIQITTRNYGTSISTPFTVGTEFFINQPAHFHPILKILQAVYMKEGLNDSIKVDIHSEIPRSVGLGSSAAVCVAFSAALALAFDLDYSLEDISHLAFKGEKIVHGTPSGVDNTIATFGGCLKYQQGKGEPVKFNDIQLILGNTRIPHETKTLTSSVRARFSTYPEVMASTIEAMGLLVEKAVKYLANGDLERLGETFNINQGLLSTIGVSTPKLDQLINIARIEGAYGAKLTGAGSGGCMFALVDEKSQQSVFQALQKNNITPILTKSEFQGVISVILDKPSSFIPPKMKSRIFSGFFTTVLNVATNSSKTRPVIR